MRTTIRANKAKTRTFAGPRLRVLVMCGRRSHHDLRRLHQGRDGDWCKQNKGGGEAGDLGHLGFSQSVSLFDDQEMPLLVWLDAW